MVTASDFRKGVTFEKDGQPCLVVDFQHVKPGKGAAFVRTKYKNLITGAIREEAFNPSDKFPKAILKLSRCSICTMMVNYTTSWTKKLLTRFL